MAVVCSGEQKSSWQHNPENKNVAETEKEESSKDPEIGYFLKPHL